MGKVNTIIFRVFGFFTALGFLLVLGGIIVDSPENGTVLNDRLIGQMRTAYVCTKVISGGVILMFLFGIGFIVLLVKKLFIGDWENFNFRVMAIILVLGVFGLATFVVNTSDVLVAVVNEPRLEIVDVFYKDTELIHSKRPHTNYYLHFRNGTKVAVDYATYNNTPEGTEYYQVLCGDTAIRTLSPDEYTLPA